MTRSQCPDDGSDEAIQCQLDEAKGVVGDPNNYIPQGGEISPWNRRRERLEYRSYRRGGWNYYPPGHFPDRYQDLDIPPRWGLVEGPLGVQEIPPCKEYPREWNYYGTPPVGDGPCVDWNRDDRWHRPPGWRRPDNGWDYQQYPDGPPPNWNGQNPNLQRPNDGWNYQQYPDGPPQGWRPGNPVPLFRGPQSENEMGEQPNHGLASIPKLETGGGRQIGGEERSAARGGPPIQPDLV